MRPDKVTDPYATIRRRAKTSLKRARALLASRRSPFIGLSLEEAIERIREVRESLWQEKFAPHH